MIVEVLSPGTESYDRGLKFEHYRSIAASDYYLLIAQDRARVEMYERESESIGGSRNMETRAPG